MLLTTDTMLAAGVPPGLVKPALDFVSALHLCHDDYSDPDAEVILREILDDPVAVMIDGSTFNHSSALDQTISDFAEVVAMHREDT